MRVQQESLFWDLIKASTDPEMFEAYLAQYPNGAFSGLAALMRDALKITYPMQIAQIDDDLQAEAETETKRLQAEAETKLLAAEEEARRLAEAEAKGLAAEEEARRQAAAEADRLAVEEEARRQAEAETERLAAEEEARRLAEAEAERLAVEAEAERLAAEEEAHRLAEAERLEEDNSSVEKATIETPFDVEITTALLLPLSEAKGEDHVYHLFDAMLLEKSGRVYASLPAVKSGAACISWVNAGDQALIHYVGLAYASPTLELAKLVALRTCRKKVAKTPEDCECVMVYENDVRVLRDSVGN